MNPRTAKASGMTKSRGTTPTGDEREEEEVEAVVEKVGEVSRGTLPTGDEREVEEVEDVAEEVNEVGEVEDEVIEAGEKEGAGKERKDVGDKMEEMEGDEQKGEVVCDERQGVGLEEWAWLVVISVDGVKVTWEEESTVSLVT